MTECGSRVGKGLVTYPCELDRGHDGPCMARENQVSQRQRKAWEAQQAEAIMVPVEEMEVPAPTMTGQVDLPDVPHTLPSDTLIEARQALLDAATAVEKLIDIRAELGKLLDEVEAGLPEEGVGARSAASMLRAMLRA